MSKTANDLGSRRQQLLYAAGVSGRVHRLVGEKLANRLAAEVSGRAFRDAGHFSTEAEMLSAVETGLSSALDTMFPGRGKEESPVPLQTAISAAEKRLILSALAATNGDKNEAAQRLAIEPERLAVLMKRHSITPSYRPGASSDTVEIPPLAVALQELEAQMIKDALTKTGWDFKLACEMLGLEHLALVTKILAHDDIPIPFAEKTHD